MFILKSKGGYIINTSTNVKTNFIMPDSDVSVTPIWLHQYLNITSGGTVSANDTLKARPKDNSIYLVIPSEINGIQVSAIAPDAFGKCISIGAVDIPEGIITIGTGAFQSCGLLRSIRIPASVTSIGSNAFIHCDKLTTIYINKPRNSISGAPWGVNHATINWLG